MNLIKLLKWFFIDQFMLGFGGGGSSGGGTTQQSNQYSSLSPWAQPYVTSILGAAQNQVFQTAPNTTDASGNVTPGQITGINPYNAYGSFNAQGGQYGLTPSDQAAAQAAVAGFNPMQQQSYQGAANLQTPGQFGQATGAAGMGTMQSLMAGQNLAQQSTNPNAVGAYMNPYLQNALAPAQQLLNQQYGMAGAQQQGAATQQGAFGGSRNALQQGLNQQNQMLAQNQLVGNAYQQAYGNAQNQMNTVAQTGLQGAAQGISGANTLANIGTGQLAAQQGILGLQNQYGGQQQQQQQNIINAAMTNYQTAQQYPMTQLQQLKGLATGLPIADVTTTAQQAQPSAVTQLAGLGTAGVAGLALANKGDSSGNIQTLPLAAAAGGGLMKSYAAGGSVKGYAPGGIAALNRKALLDPTSMSQQQLKTSTQDGAITPQVGGIAQAIQLSEKVKGDNAAAASAPPPQGTIMDELQAKSSQMDQADAMQEIIPKAMAVLKHKMENAIEKGDMPLAQKYADELQQLAQIAQGQQAPQQAPQEAPSAPAPEGIQQLAAQPPTQGIDAAPSNLPEKTMAQGGIATFSSRGLVDEDEYESAEDREDAELKQLFGSGSDNDFVQSIMPAAGGYAAHPSAAISVRPEPESSAKGAKGTHKYEQDVIKEAKRIGLDPSIAVHALYKETGGLKDPESARSKAGAIGVMQLMPKTAKEIGVDPYNPQENISGGVGYLKKMYDKYQDPQLALMAYNAGPGRVDRALKSSKGIESLPHETLAYRMAAGGIAHFDGKDSSLVKDVPEVDAGNALLADYLASDAEKTAAYKADIARENRALLDRAPAPNNADIARRELGIEGTGIPSALRSSHKTLSSRLSQLSPDAKNYGVKDTASWDDNAWDDSSPVPSLSSPAAANAVSQGSVANRDAYRNAPAVRPSAGIDTSAMISPQMSLGQGESIVHPVTAAITQAQTERRNQPNAIPDTTTESTATPSAKSFMDQLQEEIWNDLKSRKEESKKQRETNNLLAIMQTGFGVAASKNIHPLGAIGEGGAQGIASAMASRKQEAEDNKDIAAQQLGLYKYKAASEAEMNKAAALERYREATLGKKLDPEEIVQGKIDKAMQSNPQIADLKNRMALEAKNGTLTAELETKYQAQINKIIGSIHKRYGASYEPVDVGTITAPPPPKKKGFFEGMFGSSTPEPTPGWGPVTVKQQ